MRATAGVVLTNGGISSPSPLLSCVFPLVFSLFSQFQVAAPARASADPVGQTGSIHVGLPQIRQDEGEGTGVLVDGQANDRHMCDADDGEKNV
jgi:hypothetical protein